MAAQVDKVYICNQALIETGNDVSIESLDEKSPEAQRCKRLFDSTYKTLLSQYNFSFSEKLVQLSRISDNVLGYKYSYSYPAEALRINNVYMSEEDYKLKKHIDREQNFTVSNINGNKVILSNDDCPFASINIEPNISTLPETFVRVFVLKLAEQLIKVSGIGDDVLKRVKEDFNYEMSLAISSSAREADNKLKEDNPYIDVRG